MNALTQYPNAIYSVEPVVRKNLDFRLNEIPRFWFGGDPFRTRMFDALSLTFPDGERYFIESVRLFRDKIKDPDLQARVADFIRQEAQHGMAHDKMNKVMKEQGMPVDQFIQHLNRIFKFELTRRSPQYNIAMTAAAEHLTALMAETFYSKKETLVDAHPYVRALLAWHAIEEMEHRDVAFDVMKQVGEVPEATRKFALAFTTFMMFGFTLYRTDVMLRYDGFSRLDRVKMLYKGLPWFFGKKGMLTSMKSQYLDWFKKDFHPSQHPVIHQYQVWVDTLAATNDPIQAGEAFWQAAK
ncbi:metal-dependent hydrolase [Acinetobacter shaoyimingii]|uniref:Metal-dependent hydrolase n=1 Tax=Acinetobacter shaoyimingii TaxID=2715164 RepID=A0A6G8RTB3_9GAMM|nr:metal-dependent hydrolase [Acinetobacter shaoyimingii]QIO05131.1 metal-dependent hydrolase [Acinetobacter shaoyimingii]